MIIKVDDRKYAAVIEGFVMKAQKNFVLAITEEL
jgi:hypothetical protein